ncbi:hypothetical protein TNCV_3824321 [Trichonephila clavipes]|nr:hypothetical protein TNCV_3824321 [Trichonephila clavipes]
MLLERKQDYAYEKGDKEIEAIAYGYLVEKALPLLRRSTNQPNFWYHHTMQNVTETGHRDMNKELLERTMCGEYGGATGYEPRNFETRSNDEDDTPELAHHLQTSTSFRREDSEHQYPPYDRSSIAPGPPAIRRPRVRDFSH